MKRGNVSVNALLEYSNSRYSPDEKRIEEMCKRDECFRELYAASKRMKVRNYMWLSIFSFFRYVLLYVYVCVRVLDNEHSENILHVWCYIF